MNAERFAFKLIVEKTENWGQDTVTLPENLPRSEAGEKALSEFLQVMQLELEDARLEESQVQEYREPLTEFVSQPLVQETLLGVFDKDCKTISTDTLAQTWTQLNLTALPEGFNWEAVARIYFKQIKAFVHARELVDRLLNANREDTLTLDDIKRDVFLQHLFDEPWHEVMRQIVRMIAPELAAELLDSLIENPVEPSNFTHLFVAAECLAVLPDRTALTSTANQLRDRLQFLTQYPEVDELILTRLRAISTLARVWKTDLDTLPWLQSLVESPVAESIRMSAVDEIALSWKERPEILSWLKTLAQSSVAEITRVSAVRSLATHYRQDP
ncbi:HEAT repeat domain-containing protein, partial [Phormidium pseudopriestleyi FRX01]